MTFDLILTVSPNLDLSLHDGGFRYDLSQTFELITKLNSEDVVLDLFGPTQSQGYDFGDFITKEMNRKSGGEIFSDIERMTSLLKIALPILNRRLSLSIYCTEELNRWSE